MSSPIINSTLAPASGSVGSSAGGSNGNGEAVAGAAPKVTLVAIPGRVDGATVVNVLTEDEIIADTTDADGKTKIYLLPDGRWFLRITQGPTGFAKYVPPRHKTGGSLGSPKPKGSKKKSKKDAMNGSWRTRSSTETSTGTSSSASSGDIVYSDGIPLSQEATYRATSTVQDPQSVYLPAACVFVANLPSAETDMAIEYALTRVFQEFGPVWVKVRRDGKGLPYSFCQYASTDHADRAIAEGARTMILGRPCRVEKARCQRDFLVQRKDNRTIRADEALGIMQVFGPVSFTRPLTMAEKQKNRVGGGVMVSFEHYMPGQEAHNHYRNNSTYKVVPWTNMGSDNLSPAGRLRINRFPVISPSAQAEYLKRYDVDRRSVYLGALPAEITESEVRGLVGDFGEIANVELREGVSKYDANAKIVTTFVEFKDPLSVARAIAAKSVQLNGRCLHISAKRSDGYVDRSGNGRNPGVQNFQSPPAFAHLPPSPPWTQGSSGYPSPIGQTNTPFASAPIQPGQSYSYVINGQTFQYTPDLNAGGIGPVFIMVNGQSQPYAATSEHLVLHERHFQAYTEWLKQYNVTVEMHHAWNNFQVATQHNYMVRMQQATAAHMGSFSAFQTYAQTPVNDRMPPFPMSIAKSPAVASSASIFD